MVLLLGKSKRLYLLSPLTVLIFSRVFPRRGPKYIAQYAEHSYSTILHFHNDLMRRGRGIGISLADRTTLGRQVEQYGEVLKTDSSIICQAINRTGKGLHRACTSGVTHILSPTYESCAIDKGITYHQIFGSISPAKKTMEDFINQQATDIFTKTTLKVQAKLKKLGQHMEGE